jgi:1,4-dihydroxy-2-naphthoate polyprenyltransferase
VHTLPVLVGETAARIITFTAIILAYAVTAYLIAVPRFLTPALLVVFFAAPRGLKALRLLSRPRPTAAPPGYPVWPRWFSTVAFIHNRRFGNLFILGVALDTALRLIFPAFWRFQGPVGM